MFRPLAEVAPLAGIKPTVFAVGKCLSAFFVVLVHQIVVLSFAIGLSLD